MIATRRCTGRHKNNTAPRITRPRIFAEDQSASARLTHPPIFTCSRSLSPFHSPVCAAHDRDPSIHIVVIPARPSTPSRPIRIPDPSQPPAGSATATLPPAGRSPLPFRNHPPRLLLLRDRWQTRPRPRPRPFPPLLSRSRRSGLPPPSCLSEADSGTRPRREA